MEKNDVIAALKDIAGTPRVLIYDVAEEDGPERTDWYTPFVRGAKPWWSFIERRRTFDDGSDLTLLISMRGLRVDERLLMVNWGTAFANSFLVIEPSDPWLDLTTNEGIAQFAGQSRAKSPQQLVRRAYADWIYWVRDSEGQLESRNATLGLSDENETLWQALWERLPSTFPAEDFLSSLTLLNLREAELFTGGREVARAIMPFLTRLGLPILYDARHVLSAVRELVNAGLAWVRDPESNRVYSGPSSPIPPEVPDERLALMLR